MLCIIINISLSWVQESRFEDDDHGNLQLGAHHPTEFGLQHSYTLHNNMALSILPFRSNYSDKTPLSSPPDSGPGLDSELEIHPAPIQQSQEEVGGEYAHRGRHEIVLGAASALIES